MITTSGGTSPITPNGDHTIFKESSVADQYDTELIKRAHIPISQRKLPFYYDGSGNVVAN